MKHFYFKSIFLSLLMVVLGNVGALAQDTWVATDPGDLADGDVVAIVDLNDEVAMPNNNGASNAPVATKVTLSSDNTQITSSVAKNLQWTVMRSGDTYQFYASVEEDNETWLYCTNTNNGVRVGTNSNKNFNIVTDPNNNHANYLFNTATSRYFGVFIQNGVAQDWRCYTSINNNIKGTITKFFKKVASTRTLLGIQLSDYTTEFFVGDEFSFGGTVTALYEGGSTVAVTGSATFTGYDMSTPGNQTVTVSYSEGNVTKTDTYNITVKNRTLQSISAVAPKTEFEVGDTFTFGGTVTATYDDESTKDVTDEATFSGYNMSEAGTYPVTVSYTEGEVTKTAEYTITVSSVAPSSVTIEPDEVTVYLGNTSQLTATVGPNNATDKTVTWSSDNESVATVDQSGLVTPVSEGTAVITASANGAEGVKGECLITVAELTGDAYTLVTNVSDLKANDKVIIVNTEAGKAMGQQNNNNRAATEVNFDDDNNAIVPSNSDIQVFTLEGNSNGWYFNTGSGYIYAASNSSNHLKTQNGKDDNAKAVITITSDGTSVVFQRTNGRNTLQYNSTNDIFSCYASASQLPVQIYKMDGGEPALTYTLVAGEEETPFEGLTLAKELPAQVEFYIKDSNGNEYHSAEAQSELIIIAENHENLPTSPNGKNFYISKANTWVFTLTEPTNADESLTLTVVPQTPGETKYMLTPDYLVESELFFDDNFQVTKEFSASEAFFITRSDDYGLANLTAAESNVHEGGVETRVWEFSEDAPTVGFIPGKVLNTFCMKEAGIYTVALDFTNNTVTVTDEVTAIGNLNNSDTGVFAGEEGFSSGTHNITGTLTTAVGDVTVNYNGTTNSYLNDNHIRTYLNGTTLKFTAPSGYDLTKIVLTISSGNSKNLTADCGEYELTADKIATWTGSERAVTFTGQTSTNRITTAEVTLEEAAPRAQLESIAVEGQKTEFLVGSTFEFGGTVTATYDDESTKDVTEDATFSEPDMTTPGEQTVTVSYTEDEVTKTVDYTITVKEPETIKFRKITSTDELEAGKRYVLVNEEAQKVIAEYYNLHFNVNDATISDERVTLLETEANILTLGGEEGAWTFATSIEADKYLALTSAGNYLESKDDGESAQWTISFDEAGNAVIQSNYITSEERVIRYNSSQPRFACYKGTQKPVQLYVESDLEDVTLTISAAGYATLYYSDRALKVPEGVTAKTYKVVDGKLAESKTYASGSKIPKGEAVVLKGAPGEYTFKVTSTAEPKDADNQLKGSDEAEMTTGGNYYYALQAKAKDGSGGPGMYWMNSTGAAFENGAHKAYLALDEKFAEAQSVGGAKSFYLFDEATTGISSIGAETDDRTEMYNLNGQRVDRGYKGVVIKNGKKFLKK